MLDALIASWSGTTDETWFILRDLALRPPEVDPLADIPSPAGLPPEAQSEIGRKTLRALRTVVRQRALHLARKLAPPPTRPVTQLRGRAREHRARSSPRARAAPSAAAADADPEPPPSPPPSRLLTTRSRSLLRFQEHFCASQGEARGPDFARRPPRGQGNAHVGPGGARPIPGGQGTWYDRRGSSGCALRRRRTWTTGHVAGTAGSPERGYPAFGNERKEDISCEPEWWIP